MAKAAGWQKVKDVQAAFLKAKAMNGEQVRFVVSGVDYRLSVAFDFRHGIVSVKFVGTHADYDRIDALTVTLIYLIRAAQSHIPNAQQRFRSHANRKGLKIRFRAAF